MAVFLFGVAVGWVSTLVLWFIGSFGLISGLLLGSLIGTAAIFSFLMMQWGLRDLVKSQDCGSISANETVRADPDKAFF